jgi:hypothetical protein
MYSVISTISTNVEGAIGEAVSELDHIDRCWLEALKTAKLVLHQ